VRDLLPSLVPTLIAVGIVYIVADSGFDRLTNDNPIRVGRQGAQ
jgi:hypothetical protein